MGTNYRIAEHIDEVISDADIIYMEPVIQPDYTISVDEQPDDYGITPDNYKITREVMSRAKGDSIVLHSLPRMDELHVEVDNLKHARYWQEAFNGVVMRMAILSSVLGVWE
jgi:aspartate carbamoyltransferase catalytic subunit